MKGQMQGWTAWCSMPETPRGQYDEEVDVQARNPAEARRKAQAVLDEDYVPALRIRRVTRAYGVTIISF